MGKNINRPLIEKLLKEGKKKKDIAREAGCSVPSVLMVQNELLNQEMERVYRVQCQTCKYQNYMNGRFYCNYENLAHKKRKEAVETCQKWREC